MPELRNTLNDLQNDAISILRQLSGMLMANNENGRVGAKRIDDYLCELENLCVKSRMVLDKYRPQEPVSYTHLDVYKRQVYSQPRVQSISGCRCSQS